MPKKSNEAVQVKKLLKYAASEIVDRYSNPIMFLHPNWEQNLKQHFTTPKGKLLSEYSKRVKAISKLIVAGLAVIK